DLCLSVMLIGAAVISAAVCAVLGAAGIPLLLQVLVFLFVWALLGWIADGYCASRSIELEAAVAPRVTVPDRMAETPSTSGEEDTHSTVTETSGATESARPNPVAEETSTRQAEADAAPETLSASGPMNVDRDGNGAVEGIGEGTKPDVLKSPRGGAADDLKKIKGIGPKLEKVCNGLGFYHFDQIANWTSGEVAWVDSNLEGFRGRVTRDDWVAQAKLLAAGGETDFSKRVDEGDVPSSQ
ncbi:MAG: endonuclease, partial [Pseudomonadota bacterium]